MNFYYLFKFLIKFLFQNEKSITNGHLCGEISTDNLNFTSSSSRVDFKFITDSNADFRGFEIVVSAFNDGK